MLPDEGRAIHIFLSSVLFAFSLVLEMPGDTFGSSSAFAGFAEIGSETQWGYALGLSSMLGFVGYAARSPALRTLSIFFLASVHGVIADRLWRAVQYDHWVPGPLTYSLIAALGYYLCLLRISRR